VDYYARGSTMLNTLKKVVRSSWPLTHNKGGDLRWLGGHVSNLHLNVARMSKHVCQHPAKRNGISLRIQQRRSRYLLLLVPVCLVFGICAASAVLACLGPEQRKNKRILTIRHPSASEERERQRERERQQHCIIRQCARCSNQPASYVASSTQEEGTRYQIRGQSTMEGEREREREREREAATRRRGEGKPT
jgi:hypothetical protein